MKPSYNKLSLYKLFSKHILHENIMYPIIVLRKKFSYSRFMPRAKLLKQSFYNKIMYGKRRCNITDQNEYQAQKSQIITS